MTEESFGIYLDTRTRDNVLSPETFAVAFSAHNDALQAAREMMLADCAGKLGKNIDEFNAARGQAREMMRTGRLKAPSDRELLESLILHLVHSALPWERSSPLWACWPTGRGRAGDDNRRSDTAGERVIREV